MRFGIFMTLFHPKGEYIMLYMVEKTSIIDHKMHDEWTDTHFAGISSVTQAHVYFLFLLNGFGWSGKGKKFVHIEYNFLSITNFLCGMTWYFLYCFMDVGLMISSYYFTFRSNDSTNYPLLSWSHYPIYCLKEERKNRRIKACRW